MSAPTRFPGKPLDISQVRFMKLVKSIILMTFMVLMSSIMWMLSCVSCGLWIEKRKRRMPPPSIDYLRVLKTLVRFWLREGSFLPTRRGGGVRTTVIECHSKYRWDRLKLVSILSHGLPQSRQEKRPERNFGHVGDYPASHLGENSNYHNITMPAPRVNSVGCLRLTLSLPPSNPMTKPAPTRFSQENCSPWNYHT